jgi:hypothetical protein
MICNGFKKADFRNEELKRVELRKIELGNSFAYFE